MRTRRLPYALTSVLLLASCSKKGGEQVPVAPEASAVPAASAEAPPPTLTPVQEPDEVFLRGRVESPSAVLDAMVTEWGESYDWRARLASEGGEGLELIDLDAPVDMIVVVDQDSEEEVPLLGAFSIGVRSIDLALKDFEEDSPVRRLPDGVFREQADADDSDDVVCEVGPSRDAAAGRIVCGFGGELALDRLGPYMRRGEFERLSSPSSMAMSLDVDPVRRRFKAEFDEAMQGARLAGGMGVASIQDAGLREATSLALRALADEVVHVVEDLGVIGFEAQVGGPQGGAQFSTFARMTGKRSWLVRTLVGGEDVMAPAPAAFFALPISVLSAGFSHSKLTEQDKEVGRVLREMVLGAAREFDFPTKKLTKALELQASVATAYTDRGVLRATFPSGEPDPKWPKELNEAMRTLEVMVASAPRVPGDEKLIKAWVDVYNDRAMQKKLSSLSPELKELPRVSWKRVSGKAKLPTGSYELRIRVPKIWLDIDKGMKVLPELYYIMVPTPERMLTALSFDREAALDALRSVLKPSGATLAGDPEAQRFKDMKVSNGLWMSMSGENLERAMSELAPTAGSADETERQIHAAFQSWTKARAGKDIPALTEWSTVDDLTWRSDWRAEREAVRAGMELVSQIYREVEGAEGETTEMQRAPSPGEVPTAPAKKRYAPKGGK